MSATEREGRWRESVFCLDPHRLEPEDCEDPAEKEARCQRFVQFAMHEQSMGRPGSKMYEVNLPVDLDALTCADLDTRAEWDALNQYHQSISGAWLASHVSMQMSEDVSKWVLKSSGGGLSNLEAHKLVESSAPVGGDAVSLTSLDPTQASFARHMQEWLQSVKAHRASLEDNLPVPDEGRIGEPVLLLGTAGTGKTTTLQAVNQMLEAEGMGGRVLRAAFTGVAASNMGAGGRTLMSLFRIPRKVVGGVLPPLSTEDLEAMAAELGPMAVLEIDEISMVERLVLAHIHRRLQQWRLGVYHPVHCVRRTCRCGARMPFGGVKLVLAGDFGQLPPVAVTGDKTLLCPNAISVGQTKQEINLGFRLFKSIRNVFRLRRIHRQVGQSLYKESLLRLRDAAHTKEDVELWRTHDLTAPACTLSPAERVAFEQDRVHLFCERQRAGQFNGRRLGEHASRSGGNILRLWSVDSSPMVERHGCDKFGGLRRVLHVAVGCPVMLTMNLQTPWNLVNGLRGTVVAVLPKVDAAPGSAAGVGAPPALRNASEVGGVSVHQAEYVVVDFPGYVGPCMVSGQPTWVCLVKQQARHEAYRSLSRTQFPLVLSYGITVHKSQGLTLAQGCVFNMDHEPTWSPFKNMCGLAFVGVSRVTDFSLMAFKYVPDYWKFRSVSETEMFRWREALELRLDSLHDATAEVMFPACASVDDDVTRHKTWSEARNGRDLSEEEVADLRFMLSVRGMLRAPGYTDKPQKALASKAGGGRGSRKVMRGSDRREVVDMELEEERYPWQEEEISAEQENLREEALARLRAEEARKAQNELIQQLRECGEWSDGPDVPSEPEEEFEIPEDLDSFRI